MGSRQKWYRGTHLQGSNRDTDAENRWVDMEGWDWGINAEMGIDIHNIVRKADR